MRQVRVTIINKLGLHARATLKFVTAAARFTADITLSYSPERKANAKSFMGIMMIGAPQGSELTLTAEGNDEDQAINKLVELIQNRFGESE